MSTHTDSLAAAAADAVTAPLDLLLTDAAIGALRRMNPGGSALRLAGALAVRPSLVASQGRLSEEKVEQKPAGRIGNETRFGQPKPAGRRKANTTLKDLKADGGAGSARNS
jgi:hypothetical protein